ncbi:MAG TPA: hypothetical protein PLN32_05160, partial [Methanoregulaceae archaeon]|nr:hypothetical protein [Methanoregulaceae archaeon]
YSYSGYRSCSRDRPEKTATRNHHSGLNPVLAEDERGLVPALRCTLTFTLPGAQPVEEVRRLIDHER